MVLAAIIDAAGMTTALPECHATALSEHGEQLLEELRLLDDMPQVKLTNACVFDRGNGHVANKEGCHLHAAVLRRPARPGRAAQAGGCKKAENHGG